MDAPELDIEADDDEITFELEEITDPNDPAWKRAEADIAAGRYVTNDRVIEWLESLGTDNPLPRPTWRK